MRFTSKTKTLIKYLKQKSEEEQLDQLKSNKIEK